MSAGKFRWLLAGVALAAISATTSVQAATVNCPGTVATTDREFSLNTSGTAVCIGSGTGNINANNDAINLLGYVSIDKSDNNTAYVGVNGELSITGTGGLSGEFSFTPVAGYYNYVLGLKSGNGQLDPDWVAFLLPDGITSGLWAIITGNQSLSHANLYAQACPTSGCPETPPEGAGETPIPGAVLLFGSVLAGGIGVMRRRKKVPSSA